MGTMSGRESKKVRLYRKAEGLDDLADNETEDEEEYHRLRRQAAKLREQADAINE
jgi:hypothetical protein